MKLSEQELWEFYNKLYSLTKSEYAIAQAFVSMHGNRVVLENLSTVMPEYNLNIESELRKRNYLNDEDDEIEYGYWLFVCDFAERLKPLLKYRDTPVSILLTEVKDFITKYHTEPKEKEILFNKYLEDIETRYNQLGNEVNQLEEAKPINIFNLILNDSEEGCGNLRWIYDGVFKLPIRVYTGVLEFRDLTEIEFNTIKEDKITYNLNLTRQTEHLGYTKLITARWYEVKNTESQRTLLYSLTVIQYIREN